MMLDTEKNQISQGFVVIQLYKLLFFRLCFAYITNILIFNDKITIFRSAFLSDSHFRRKSYKLDFDLIVDLPAQSTNHVVRAVFHNSCIGRIWLFNPDWLNQEVIQLQEHILTKAQSNNHFLSYSIEDQGFSRQDLLYKYGGYGYLKYQPSQHFWFTEQEMNNGVKLERGWLTPKKRSNTECILSKKRAYSWSRRQLLFQKIFQNNWRILIICWKADAAVQRCNPSAR